MGMHGMKRSTQEILLLKLMMKVLRKIPRQKDVIVYRSSKRKIVD
jgi:hypothetical protein